jgi:putative redox protein
MEVVCTLVDGQAKFSSTTRGLAPVVTDSSPPFGEGIEYKPLELFLISLATCAATTVAPILRKKRRTVERLVVTASGTRREEHPTSFVRIVLRFELTSPDATDEDVRRSIELAEEKYCPVWAMVRGNVEVSTPFEILRG